MQTYRFSFLSVNINLTCKRLGNCTHTLNSKVGSTLLGLVALGSNRIGDLLDAIRTQVRDEDEGTSSTGITAIGLNLSCGTGAHSEGVRRGGGGLLPLNGAVASLCPDAVGVNLRLQKLTSSKVVTLDSSRLSSEILDTVCWGPAEENETHSPKDLTSHIKLTSMWQYKRFVWQGC